MDATEFIRDHQRQEGYDPCFRTKTECDQTGCAWRIYCLKNGPHCLGEDPDDDYVEILHTWMITKK